MTDLFARGWAHAPYDRELHSWAEAAYPVATKAVEDPANAHWHQCEGTWFVGVDALPNDTKGRVPDGPPLQGHIIDDLTRQYGTLPPLHAAQVSVIYPGYPRPRAGETGAAARYRRNRYAAHVDGLLPTGPDRQRMLKEPHMFILGLPLHQTGPSAAPLVVWDGSHHIIRAAFQKAFEGHPPATWPQIDVTTLYQEARRKIFDTCRRIELPAQPGEATLIHRHTLHGVAPWTEQEPATTEHRMIAYFRPQYAPGTSAWLTDP